MKAGVHFMELRRDCMKLCFALVYLSILITLFTQCEARLSKKAFKASHSLEDLIRTSRGSIIKTSKNLKQLKHFDIFPMSGPNEQPYVSSPFSLPPFESLAPIPLPENAPPFCEYPPLTPQAPSTVIPTPIIYTTPPPPPEFTNPTPIFPFLSPPSSPISISPSPPETLPTPNPPESAPSPPGIFPTPNPPESAPSPPGILPTPNPPESAPSPPGILPTPNPPESAPSPPTYIPGPPSYTLSPPEFVPSPPQYVPGPPEYVPSPPQYVPGPPEYEPSPPSYIPSPYGFVPSPPVFQPPVIYPPPNVPPSPHKGPGFPRWCVAKPSVPDPIIQEAMNYACGSGADCGSIQPSGSCYNPVTLLSHASYAFNSYWQRTKAAGGTCDFGGTAMLVTVDPSFDGCQFLST